MTHEDFDITDKVFVIKEWVDYFEIFEGVVIKKDPHIYGHLRILTSTDGEVRCNYDDFFGRTREEVINTAKSYYQDRVFIAQKKIERLNYESL